MHHLHQQPSGHVQLQQCGSSPFSQQLRGALVYSSCELGLCSCQLSLTLRQLKLQQAQASNPERCNEQGGIGDDHA